MRGDEDLGAAYMLYLLGAALRPARQGILPFFLLGQRRHRSKALRRGNADVQLPLISGGGVSPCIETAERMTV